VGPCGVLMGTAVIIYLVFGGQSGNTQDASSRQHALYKTSNINNDNNHLLAPTTHTIRLRSGLEMPAVGYGTCCRPSAQGEQIYQSTLTYLTHGGRLIDTAMAYKNHVEIGRAIRDAGMPRDKLWITSKIAPGKVKTYQQCLAAVDTILQELGTTYLDLLLIHTPKLGKTPTIDLWKALIEAKRLGKVKAIGVSNFNQGEMEDIAKATAGGEMPEANEIQLHPWSSPAWKDLATWQSEQGIATIAYTSLGGSRFHKAGGGGTRWPEIVTTIANKYSATEAQVLLQWALRQNIAVIPGSGSEEHIKENLLLSPQFELSEKEAKDIENANVPGAWWDPKRGPIKYNDEEAREPWAQRKNG